MARLALVAVAAALVNDKDNNSHSQDKGDYYARKPPGLCLDEVQQRIPFVNFDHIRVLGMRCMA